MRVQALVHMSCDDGSAVRDLYYMSCEEESRADLRLRQDRCVEDLCYMSQ